MWQPQPWHWMAFGVICAVLEFVAAGTAFFVLLTAGVSAIIVGMVLYVFPTIDVVIQVLAFAVLTIAGSIMVAIPMRRRYATPQGDALANVGTSRFIGKLGILDTPIQAGRGSVSIGDTVWPVTGPDLPAGTRVKVVGTDGMTLQVQPADAH
jgi:inner membrane protein